MKFRTLMNDDEPTAWVSLVYDFSGQRHKLTVSEIED
jgi:hypothetical protein